MKKKRIVPQPKPGRGLLLEPDKPTKEEAKLVNLTKERAWSYDEHGQPIKSVDGTADRVILSDDMLQPGFTVTHNHPSGASFSIDDLYVTAMNELREIRVIGADGRRRVYLYRFSFKPGLSLKEKLKAASLYDTAKDTVFKRAKVRIIQQTLTAKELDREREHWTMQELKSLLPDRINYERILLP